MRLRLTQSEVLQFARTGLVEETVAFPSTTLRYQLLRAKTIAADFVDGTLTISLPEEAAQNWIDSIQVGVEAKAGDLEILVEKDFQCAHGPSDPDAFAPQLLSKTIL